ncbi:MAG: FGGY family carbohydrate kinase [Paracoccaceae bacterium]|nr:FGGY family carbohydrate kinase [Paracoccaceae bacterium]
MPNDKLIGIDVGTTSVKAAVLDKSGTVHSSFAESYSTKRTGDTIVEQNPEDWVRLIEKALSSFELGQVTAIGLCSQVNTHVFIDADGNALCPAILWQDRRASDEATAFDAQVTVEQKEAWWGAPMPIDASHAISRMAWIAKHRPDIWTKTRWVMLPKDYCMLKLTGQASTDPLSNIGLVDNDLNYITEVLALVPGAAERMAPLFPITDIAGVVKQGPLKGTPIVSGTMDAWAGLVGTGGAKEQSSIYLSGTSEILGISSTKVVPTPGAIVFPEAHGLRLHAAPTQNGGDAKLWFTQVSGITMEEMSAMVAETTRSAATPLFLPQLEGERAPHWDPDLRGAFLGVSRQTRLPDFARAVYEGVAFAARQALETLKISAAVDSDIISCGGGGFRSQAWTQIRADVLNTPLQTLTSGEPGISGAVTLAAIGTGIYSSFEAASSDLTQYSAPHTPDPEKADFYASAFEIYKEAITENANIGKRLTQLSEGLQAR